MEIIILIGKISGSTYIYICNSCVTRIPLISTYNYILYFLINIILLIYSLAI